MSEPIAVVTGASSGIGHATARLLAESGYLVYCVARRTERVEKLAKDIGGRAVTCDVSEQEQVSAMAEAVGPKLDLLVNNAGRALGVDSIADADTNKCRAMYGVEVLRARKTAPATLPATAPSGPGASLHRAT